MCEFVKFYTCKIKQNNVRKKPGNFSTDIYIYLKKYC